MSKLGEFRKLILENPRRTPSGLILPLQREYLVKTTYPISLVYTFFQEKYKKGNGLKLDGDWVSINNIRIATFLEKGTKCAICGIEGKFFSKEKSWDCKYESYHLNLYAVGKNGGLTMMTMDHIVPKSKGGPDTLDNAQVLCERCNRHKSDMTSEEFTTLIAENRGHLWFS